MDALKEVWGSVTERLKNPLLTSFVIAWLITNYRLILVLLSNDTFKNKLDYIDSQQLLNLGTNINNLFLHPIYAALFYTCIFPGVSVITTFTTHFWEVINHFVTVSVKKIDTFDRNQRTMLNKENAELSELLKAHEDRSEAAKAEARRRSIGGTAPYTQMLTESHLNWFLNQGALPEWRKDTVRCMDWIQDDIGDVEVRDFLTTIGIPNKWANLFPVMATRKFTVEDFALELDIERKQAASVAVILTGLGLITANWADDNLMFTVHHNRFSQTLCQRRSAR